MSNELKTVGFLVDTEFLFPDEVPEGYVEGTDLVDRSEAEAEIARLKEALGLIAEWPVTHPKQNMDAFNMKHIAIAALNPGEQDGR